MNPFKKKTNPVYSPQGGVYQVSTFKEVESVSDNGDHLVSIEEKRVSVDDFAKTIVTPTSEQYSLEKILATGQLPQEVKVTGMLPTDDTPDVVSDFIRLKGLSDVSKPVEPTTNSEPTNE